MNSGVGVCEPFPSIWGHWAGGACLLKFISRDTANIANQGPGQSTEDVKWLDQKLKKFFGDA